MHNNISTEKRKKLVFYILMVAPLVLQVLIFYFYVNISNIALAFKKFETVSRKGTVGSFVGFENFKFVIDFIFSSDNSQMITETFITYGILLFIAMPVGLFFSYYIFKSFPFSGFFRVILFMPQIISSVAMTMLFKTLTIDVFSNVFGVEGGLLRGYDGTITFITLAFYMLWMGFGGNILLYCGGMSGINDSIIEACHLDGCNNIQEFFHIVLPSIYSTIVTFVIIDISGIFVNNMNLYTFFGQNSLPNGISGPIGYLLVKMTAQAGFEPKANNAWWSYSQISALGVLITLFTVPVSILVKKTMEKLGPSED